MPGDILTLLGQLGMGGVMVYLIFFKLLPEMSAERDKNTAERERRDVAFLDALEKRDVAVAKREKEHREQLEQWQQDGNRTRVLIRAAMMVLTGQCPDTNLQCPFKIAELMDDEARKPA